ncbi:MAG: twin-arginine translocase TatA/TatE family subunit [Bacteroidales bacterium]|nr:twin-arginine translocase TatA/TatE family subunit [Bacteroidales bacterium]
MVQFAGFLGGYELLVIVVVVLLLFGGKKIPELARGLGKGIKDFKKATEDSDLAGDLKDVATEIKEMKDGVEKLNPKNMLKPDNTLKSKKGK